jgi:hypothetical protein
MEAPLQDASSSASVVATTTTTTTTTGYIVSDVIDAMLTTSVDIVNARNDAVRDGDDHHHHPKRQRLSASTSLPSCCDPKDIYWRSIHAVRDGDDHHHHPKRQRLSASTSLPSCCDPKDIYWRSIHTAMNQFFLFTEELGNTGTVPDPMNHTFHFYLDFVTSIQGLTFHQKQWLVLLTILPLQTIRKRL